MDSLPDWAASIIAVAVGLSPGLALLIARPMGVFCVACWWSAPKQHLSREGQRVTSLWKPGDRHSAPLPRPTLGDPAASR